MARNKFADLLGEVGIAPSFEPASESAPPAVGKRSDPAYRQISTYVRSDVYRSVKRELLMDERDFSDLMAELLADWLSRRASK